MPVSKVLSIIGTRPEAIKLAPVVRALAARPDRFVSKVCLTAQHREMANEALTLFEIVPDYDLDIMSPGQTLAVITSKAIERLDTVIATLQPDVVLVQGDTTSAFCGALAAFYHKVPVGHVEAGLRTRNKYSPYPEELNRRLVGALADWHFAPTSAAADALVQEGVAANRIIQTGNTVIDALLHVRDRMRGQPSILSREVQELIDGHLLVLITGHRRESFGEGFENICRAILEVANTVPSAVFVYPVHLNPNVQAPVQRILSGHPRILLTEPLPYAPFVELMDRATVVLTDSGGVQEEAPSLGKPVLVMRQTTERPEGIAAGNARLVGVDTRTIVEALTELLLDPGARARMTSIANPYGDGHASRRIVDTLAAEVVNRPPVE